MTIQQYPGPLNDLAIEKAMKPTERVVCTNATVVMDAVTERLSYFRNDTPVCVIDTGPSQMPIGADPAELAKRIEGSVVEE